MKKLYFSPELDIIRFTLKDVILSSPTEELEVETRTPSPSLDDEEDLF